MDNLEIIAKNKGIKLYSKFENVPETIITDEQRFEEILNNLISNAIKFTEKGEIVIEVASKKDMIEVAVIDTGVGIPEESIKELFHDFYQVDSSVSRKYGGTGLGLSITKKLVELQGGSVVVRSKVGEGSKFIFTLPIKQSLKEKMEVKK
jgi:signal transduction histidine kinase